MRRYLFARRSVWRRLFEGVIGAFGLSLWTAGVVIRLAGALTLAVLLIGALARCWA